MSYPRPLSAITAEARELLDGECFTGDDLCACNVCLAHDLLAELSGRLDGAVVLTAEEANLVRNYLCRHVRKQAGFHRAAALLRGRPGKEKE